MPKFLNFHSYWLEKYIFKGDLFVIYHILWSRGNIDTLVIYYCKKKLPPNLAADNTVSLESGIQTLISWVLCFMVFHEAVIKILIRAGVSTNGPTGKRLHECVTWLLAGFSSLNIVVLRASITHSQLTRGNPQFLFMWASSTFISSKPARETKSTRKSESFLT